MVLRNGSISPQTGEMRTSCSPLPTGAAVVSPRSADPFPGRAVEAPWPGDSAWFFISFSPELRSLCSKRFNPVWDRLGGGGCAARSAQIGRTRQVVAMT